MSTTDQHRRLAWGLFLLVVVVALIGWLIGRDPTMLAPVLAAVTVAAGIGEGANVGKRATFKPEAV